MKYEHIDVDAIIAELDEHRLNDSWPEFEEDLIEAVDTAFTGVSDSCATFEKVIARRAESIGMIEEFKQDKSSAKLQEQHSTANRWSAEVYVRLRSENKYEWSEVTSELVIPYETLLRYQDIIRELFLQLMRQKNKKANAQRAHPFLYRITVFLGRLIGMD